LRSICRWTATNTTPPPAEDGPPHERRSPRRQRVQRVLPVAPVGVAMSWLTFSWSLSSYIRFICDFQKQSVSPTTTSLFPTERVRLSSFRPRSASHVTSGKLQTRLAPSLQRFGDQSVSSGMCLFFDLTPSISSYRLSLQADGVLVPAHGRAGPPRRHALGTFRHVPPQPFLTSQLFLTSQPFLTSQLFLTSQPFLTSQLSARQPPVALGVRRLRTESQPARGAVLQRLHALLRESPEREPGSAPGGVTRMPAASRRTDSCLCSQAVTAECSRHHSDPTGGSDLVTEAREEFRPGVTGQIMLHHVASCVTAAGRRALDDVITSLIRRKRLNPKDHGPASF